ncbi:DUF4097 family beta strand repeat-containing protein [Streptomyces sp. UH6]|uniref:DUF4097 family beta strand repeat-containing protein n=1 Tax=Streptomyces sp. UH6 TaxID=2748379 RepID=UPI0015D4F70E|nr:DUF4097 family beta strand repeat-containing protein [Streptomyces sp. UH6]NYV74627.1 DUF4097 family beta strand repeat protein [Streptomyces sp. UH6]
MAAVPRTARVALVATGAALALAALSGCGADLEDAEPEKRSFTTASDRLTIDTDNGDVSVRPADVDRIEVTRWFAGWALIGEPEATWKMDGDRLELKTDCGPVVGGCSARYEVLVPRDVRLTVTGDNGDIQAAGFTTALRIVTDNGDVEVSGSTGPLTLEGDNGDLRATGVTSREVDAVSDNGDVRLVFDAAPQRTSVESSNGDVTLEVPKGTAYRVDAQASNGDVSTKLPTDPDGAHRLDVRSDNGDITLHTAG